ncbi:MAG TPA: sugar phosphate nucleotidyltransferase [Candidatus Hypogeohydataceae bacterium YC40]
MKGVVLAGGLGKRLYPLTKVTNKHLLPVYNKPMIFYPIETLVRAGIIEVLLVTGGENAGDFLRLLGNGKELGLKELNYAYQEGHGGIAEALGLAEDFADKGKVVVILGDNVIEKNIFRHVVAFKQQPSGARILLKKVSHPEHFGVPVFDNGRLVAIEEKPKQAKSDLAVTGIYMYDSHVFNIIKTLERSDRGELEISDVNNSYIKEGTMTHDFLDGWWIDAGSSPDNLILASQWVKETGANNL